MIDLDEAIELLQRARRMRNGPMRLTIRKTNLGGLTAHQTVEVRSVHQGIDWEGGQLVIEPDVPLTVLTPEQLAEISKSVRAGGSWHAYKAQEALRARILELTDRCEKMEAALNEPGTTRSRG